MLKELSTITGWQLAVILIVAALVGVLRYLERHSSSGKELAPISSDIHHQTDIR